MRSGVPGHGRLAKEKLFLQREESNAGWSRNRLLLSTTRYELAKEYTMESGNDWRFEGGVARGAEIEILVDGMPLRAYDGESVAAALLAAGRRSLRTTGRLHGPRGLYCGIGLCFDCVMRIDGRPNVRTCQTPVRAGMRVESQRAEVTWETNP